VCPPWAVVLCGINLSDAPHGTVDILPETEGLSQAGLVRASEEAAKKAVLGGSTRITSDALIAAVHERKAASR
jgi:hypothetical protein